MVRRGLALLAIIGCSVAGPAWAADDDLAPAETSTQTGPQPPPVPPLNYFALLGRDEVWAELELRHQKGGDFATLIERVTRGLVAAPYLLSPLGEGEGTDPDPRFRLDSFDCTTFVETAIAMTLCDELPAAEALLDRIRYLAAPEFETRRHLMTSQSIPGLVSEGYLKDVTRQVGQKLTKTVTLELTQKRWKKRRVAKLLDLGDRVPIGEFQLDYLPVAELATLVPKIPPGSIINIVRTDAPSSPDLITHQALILVRPDGTLFVRHASPVSKRVIDETIEKIVKRYQKPRAWPILGLNVLQIVEPK